MCLRLLRRDVLQPLRVAEFPVAHARQQGQTQADRDRGGEQRAVLRGLRAAGRMLGDDAALDLAAGALEFLLADGPALQVRGKLLELLPVNGRIGGDAIVRGGLAPRAASAADTSAPPSAAGRRQNGSSRVPRRGAWPGGPFSCAPPEHAFDHRFSSAPRVLLLRLRAAARLQSEAHRRGKPQDGPTRAAPCRLEGRP